MTDIEKGPEVQVLPSHDIEPKLEAELPDPASKSKSKLQQWLDLFEKVAGLETRGIEPVEVDQRQPPRDDDYAQFFRLWLSSALTPNNMIVGLYGPSYYGLDYTDAALCAVFGSLLGSAGVGYMSTWGPRSGNRTLVATRFFLGYFPSKICCFLNILTMLGYGMVNGILGGQIIHAVSGERTGVLVGIAVVAILTWLIATVGMHLFHFYSRYAWMLQVAILCIMIGCAGPHFSAAQPSSSSSSSSSHRLSFFSLCFASAITWAPSSADYFVYFPTSIARGKMFLAALIGMGVAMVLMTLLGIGLATGVYADSAWRTAYMTSPGSLLVAAFASLHGFGRFCAVVMVLGVVSNNIPCTYSAGLNVQMLGHYALKVPRPVLTTLEVLVYTICAMLGHRYLSVIMENFLPLMSYWIVVWLTICLEEDFLFQRGVERDWSMWNVRQKLPTGVAAGTCFVMGCVGAILGMYQIYFVGPVAKAVPSECDLGMWLAIAFTMVIYPPLRFMELRLVGR